MAMPPTARTAADAAAESVPTSSPPRSPRPPTASRCSTSRAGASTSTPPGARSSGHRSPTCWGGLRRSPDPTTAPAGRAPTAAAPVDGPGIAAGAGARAPGARGAHRGRRRLTVVTFRDVTDVRVQRRRFTAFATAAANVAYAGSLRGTLDAICAQLVETAGLAGAQIFLVDASGTRMRVHGAAPVDRWPSDFALRLEEARHRGARAQLVRGAADGPPGGDPAQEGADARRPPVGAAARPARQLRLGRLRRGAAGGPRPRRRRAQRLLPARARARRRRDRVPDRDGRPGRRRGGERPAARRGPRRGRVGRAAPAGPRAARLRLPAAVLHDAAHPRRRADRRCRPDRAGRPAAHPRRAGPRGAGRHASAHLRAAPDPARHARAGLRGPGAGGVDHPAGRAGGDGRRARRAAGHRAPTPSSTPTGSSRRRCTTA